MVGLGTQDDFAYAQRFRERTEVTHQLLWDESFDSWAELGVASQPSSILFAPDGRELRRWSGLFDADEVLQLISTNQTGETTLDGSATGSELASLQTTERDAARFCRYADRFEQSQRQLESVLNGSSEAVSETADDVTFSANGLRQFSPPGLKGATETLATSASALRTQFREEDVAVVATGTALTEFLGNAAGLVEPIRGACQVEVRVAELP